ncbi:MAG: 6,7-dimethyl-8-ribityllumazine synthase [Dehalococcoidia bacterium]
MREFEGSHEGAGLRIAVIAARWNGFVVDRLVEGCINTLRQREVEEDCIHLIHVPGSFEITAAARWAAESGHYDAVICLGAVIRGETAHFEYVAGGAADGMREVTLLTGVPVVFGVLTTENAEQALERAGGKEGHKGEESAATAIEMANLRKALS